MTNSQRPAPNDVSPPQTLCFNIRLMTTGILIACAFAALLAVGAYAEFSGGKSTRPRPFQRNRCRPRNRRPNPAVSAPVGKKGPKRLLAFQFNDGGRKSAGYKGKTGDCVVRSIAIATELPYQQVYDSVNKFAKRERIGKRKRGISNARTGVYTRTTRKLLESLGWQWTPTMEIGSGCQVHLRADELPPGRLIVSVSGHLTAVVDGVIHDTHDPSRRGTRCVYGYWRRAK